MKRRRFKLVEGDLARNLADRYDVPYLTDAQLKEAPQLPLEQRKFSAKQRSEIWQAVYIAPGGISYRVLSLKACFQTSHKINHKTFAQRRTLVLINGLTRTKDHWVNFDRLLARDVNVLTLDPRGIGESRQRAQWNLSIDHMSDDVKSVLDHAGVEQAHILGFSLGGMTALMFGLRYPHRVHSLLVINSSIGGGARFPRLYPRSVLGLAKSLLKGGMSFHESLSDYVLSKRTPQEMRDWAAELWSHLEKRYGKGIMITFKQLVAASRFRNPYKLMAIKAPTMVIFGEKDHFVASSHSVYLFSYLSQGVLKGIEGGGHELHFDKSFELRDHITDFMSRDLSSYP